LKKGKIAKEKKSYPKSKRQKLNLLDSSKSKQEFNQDESAEKNIVSFALEITIRNNQSFRIIMFSVHFQQFYFNLFNKI
jgi:hypothetical protein